MSFSEKLDMIMNITKTTNSTLAKNISLDASLISRFRRGIRTPSKKENYLIAIASYFSRRITSEYQKAALCEALNVPLKNFPATDEKLSELIYQWFLGIETNANKGVDSFIDSFANFKFKNMPPIADSAASPEYEGKTGEHFILYGHKGKQTQVINFLSLILKSTKPQTLLLFSDEDFSWLADDPIFAAKWASLMIQVLMCGNRIKIIHTINRSTNEMLAAIREWLPLYMTGAIEPYYYSKTRDGIFKRTLFIAPETAAITSNTVGADTDNNAVFLYTDKASISSFIPIYNDYLKMCLPLMKIFNQKNDSEYIRTFSKFESTVADCIIKSDYPSSITMPYELFADMSPSGEDNSSMLTYQKIRIEAFERSLYSVNFTEIIAMPNIDTILTGNMKANYFDIYSTQEVFYTPAQFIRHIKNIIRLLKQYDHYTVYITPEQQAQGYLLYAKDNVGVLAAKTSTPSIIFFINEGHLAGAFWDYLITLTDKFMLTKKAETINTLEAFIKLLEAHGF